MSLPLLQTAVLLPLEFLVNRVLALDPATAGRLAPHVGRTLALQVSKPPAALYISVRQGSLHLAALHEGEATATLSGSLPALLALLLRKGRVENLRTLGLELRGHTGFVQDLQQVLSELDLDWEYHLGRVLGDIPTALLGDGLRQLRSTLRTTGSRLREDTLDFLQVESGLLPAPDEVEHFLEQVTTLTLRLDRLQARIERL